MSLLDTTTLDHKTKEALIKYLLPFVTENKKKKFNEVLHQRTRYLTVLLEDIFHPHNANACICSCECLGIQDIHVVEDKHTYDVNPKVLRGAGKWIDVHRYENTLTAISHLKSEGYKIVATMPNQERMALEHLPRNQKRAIAFGTELEGISTTLKSEADYHVHIPIYGFTESFNISVSVAITLHYLLEKIKESSPVDWKLTAEEHQAYLLDWVLKSVTRVEVHLKQFFKERRNQN